MLAEVYSMADYSTTARWIPVLSAAGCWSQRQLHAGIRYISVAVKLTISLTSVVGDLCSTLAEFYLIADYSTTAMTESNSVCGRLLGSTPATQWYKGRPGGIKAQDFADISEGGRC